MRVFIGDTETTGLGPKRKACDLALIEIHPETMEIIGELEAMLNPGCEIGAEAMAVHGITNEMVATCPSFEQWLQDTLGGSIDGDAYLIGYRVAFDEPMLRPCFTNLVKCWDALPLVQTMLHDMENHKLQTAREHLGIEGGTAHRAMGDVLTTHQLLLDLIPKSGRTLVNHLLTPFQMVHMMPWGKHKGTLLCDLPSGYRKWLLDLDELDPNLRRSLELVGSTDFKLNLPQRRNFR